MSRALKFRAWYQGKMYPVQRLEVVQTFANYTEAMDVVTLVDVATGSTVTVAAHQVEIMQFTGWHDHSNPVPQEVYEGDIVQFIDGHRGVVAWDTINDGWRIHIRQSCLLRDNEMIVIGNIWETPDLLKEHS